MTFSIRFPPIHLFLLSAIAKQKDPRISCTWIVWEKCAWVGTVIIQVLCVCHSRAFGET